MTFRSSFSVSSVIAAAAVSLLLLLDHSAPVFVCACAAFNSGHSHSSLSQSHSQSNLAFTKNSGSSNRNSNSNRSPLFRRTEAVKVTNFEEDLDLTRRIILNHVETLNRRQETEISTATATGIVDKIVSVSASVSGAAGSVIADGVKVLNQDSVNMNMNMNMQSTDSDAQPSSAIAISKISQSTSILIHTVCTIISKTKKPILVAQEKLSSFAVTKSISLPVSISTFSQTLFQAWKVILQKFNTELLKKETMEQQQPE